MRLVVCLSACTHFLWLLPVLFLVGAQTESSAGPTGQIEEQFQIRPETVHTKGICTYQHARAHTHTHRAVSGGPHRLASTTSPAHLSKLRRCQDRHNTLSRGRDVVPQVGGALCVPTHPAEGVRSDCIRQVDVWCLLSTFLGATISGCNTWEVT